MKTLSSILIGIILLAATSCDVNPSKISQKDAEDFAEQITYFKDNRTGLCFAIIATRKTASTDQNGIGLTMVPCESVQAYLPQ